MSSRAPCAPCATGASASPTRGSGFPDPGAGPEPLTDAVLFDLELVPGGYGWIFPKRDHYSAGAYVAVGSGRGLRARLDALRRQVQWLAGCPVWRTRGHGVPLGGTRERLHTERIVLAGDAADTVDPFTGEGIAYALQTGVLAARAVADRLREGKPLARYTRWLWHAVHRDLRLSRRLTAVIYRHPEARLAPRLVTPPPHPLGGRADPRRTQLRAHPARGPGGARDTALADSRRAGAPGVRPLRQPSSPAQRPSQGRRKS